MAIRNVQGLVLDLTGTLIAGAPVTCDLNVPAAVTATGQVVPGELTALTDGSGIYHFSVYANADLTPTNTSYAITIHHTTLITYAIIVPNSAYNGARPTYFDVVLDSLIQPIPPTPGPYASGMQGIQGIQGPPGGVFLAYKGIWNSGTAYILGDGVYDTTAQANFICTTAHTNHEPPNATYWGLVGPLRTGSGYGN